MLRRSNSISFNSSAGLRSAAQALPSSSSLDSGLAASEASFKSKMAAGEPNASGSTESKSSAAPMRAIHIRGRDSGITLLVRQWPLKTKAEALECIDALTNKNDDIAKLVISSAHWGKDQQIRNELIEQIYAISGLAATETKSSVVPSTATLENSKGTKSREDSPRTVEGKRLKESPKHRELQARAALLSNAPPRNNNLQTASSTTNVLRKTIRSDVGLRDYLLDQSVKKANLAKQAMSHALKNGHDANSLRKAYQQTLSFSSLPVITESAEPVVAERPVSPTR